MTSRLSRLLERMRDDRGITLSELIIVMVVTTIVLATIGTMYISTLQAERTVSELTGTTSDAQLVARSLDTAVRNGVAFEPVSKQSDGGQMLLVCTVSTGVSLDQRWQAWYYSPAGNGEIRSRTFPAGAVPDVPTEAQLAGWTLLLSGVRPLGIDTDGDPSVFAVTEAASDDLPDSVSVQFAAVGSNADSATIDFSAHLAPYSPEEEPCS